MKTHHERIVELEADVARLKWQVAQLIDAARKEHAEREAATAYAKAVFGKRLLAEPYRPEETQAEFQQRVMNKPYTE